MTKEDLWYVAARLLGVFLIVEGGLYVTGAFSAAGIGLPDGSNRLMFVLAPILQGVVSISAGAVLINIGRSVSFSSASSIASVPVDAVSVPLQILGIYLLVSSLMAATRQAVDMTIASRSWHFGVGAVASAGVGLGAGVLLIARPGQIARVLNDFRRSS